MKTSYKFLVAFWLGLSLLPLGCGKKDSPGPVQGPVTPVTPKNDGYQLVLRDDRWPERNFVVDLPLSNEAGVKSLEGYFSDAKVTTDPMGNPAVGIVSGNVIKCPADETHKWPFCLEPGTVRFDDMTTEVCDGTFSYVEENLDEWMTSVKTYCPWGTSGLIQTIKKADVVLYQRAAPASPARF